MPFGLGAPELIIVLVIIMLVFGVGKLPEVGGALGKGIREFRRSASDVEDAMKESTVKSEVAVPAAVPAAAATTWRCAACGESNATRNQFCGNCGVAKAS